MTGDREPNVYAISLTELERSAHVPVEEQISEQAEPASPLRSPRQSWTANACSASREPDACALVEGRSR